MQDIKVRCILQGCQNCDPGRRIVRSYDPTHKNDQDRNKIFIQVGSLQDRRIVDRIVGSDPRIVGSQNGLILDFWESGCSECSSESRCSNVEIQNVALHPPSFTPYPLILSTPTPYSPLAIQGLIVVPGIANQNGNGNVVAARAEGNANGNNEAGIQLQAEEFDLIAATADLDEIEETVQLSVEQGGGTVEQHPTNVEETRVLYDSLYNNLAIEVEKVNSINRKLRETNADLTNELVRYKNQEKCFEISQENYDKLERCYQQSVYQEQCLTKKINALHLSSGKQITALNEEISNLNKQLSKEKSTVSSLQEEKKRLKSDFKIREDELLDKQILGQSQQKQKSLYNGKVLLEKHDPPVVYDSKETLQLAQESRLKMKQLNKEIKPANYTKINHLSGVFVSQTAKSREESYFSNTSKTTNVSKPISIPNEELSNDTTPSVARKFLNEVKSTIVTLQRVVKQKMTLEIHNWSSSAHQEIHKIVKDEIFPIVNQVDTRVKNFEIQFLKEAAKFVRDFQSLAKEADESLAKHKALELEIERLLRAVVSQDIMSIVQNNSVIDTSNLQTELERMKECFENCIIKKENEYAKLWND
ncbi:hypothetical protein Tco_0864108 [Tanacetum coccineum]